MPKQHCYNDRYEQNHNDCCETATNPYHQPTSRSSDYITRPTYSSSDYILKASPPHRSCHPRDSVYASNSSNSDYISSPVDTKSDYISPCGGKSEYQFIKAGAWGHKIDLMHCHGFKTYEQDDFQEANHVLHKYSDVFARNADVLEAKYYGQTVSGEAASDIGSYRHGSEYEDEEDTYDKDSGICSWPSRSYSGRGSCTSSSFSDICAAVSVQEGSDYDEVEYGSHDEDIASNGTRSGSDYESSDADRIGEGSDYVSSDEEDQHDAGAAASSEVASVSDGGDEEDCSDRECKDDYMEDGYDGHDEALNDDDADDY